MSDQRSKRAYGTGRLFVKNGAYTGRWWTKDGQRVQRKVGPVKELSKRQAEGRLRELMLEQDRAPARTGKHDPTVEQLGKHLVARLEAQGRKPSHLESVRGHLRVHIGPALGSFAVSTIDRRDVAKLIDRMAAPPASKSPKTIHNVIGTLHSLLGLAVEEEYIDRNPCEGAKLPVVRHSTDIRFLTQEEVKRVLAAAPNPAETSQSELDWWPVVRLLVLVATMTGMRLGELRALRWSDLDMAAMKVRVHQSFVRGQYGTPKSRRSARAIPLATRLVSELDEHHRTTVWNQDADLVLAHPHTGRPLDRVRLLGHFKAALIRANVRPVRIHDLRHTFATTVAASGQVSLRTLQEWMGHENPTTTAIYADYMPGAREAQLLDQAFGAQSVPNLSEQSPAAPPQTPENTGERGIPT